jgi:hypothetical protein
MEEGKKIVAELAHLKYEVEHDRALTCVLYYPMNISTWPGP